MACWISRSSRWPCIWSIGRRREIHCPKPCPATLYRHLRRPLYSSNALALPGRRNICLMFGFYCSPFFRGWALGFSSRCMGWAENNVAFSFVGKWTQKGMVLAVHTLIPYLCHVHPKRCRQKMFPLVVPSHFSWPRERCMLLYLFWTENRQKRCTCFVERAWSSGRRMIQQPPPFPRKGKYSFKKTWSEKMVTACPLLGD